MNKYIFFLIGLFSSISAIGQDQHAKNLLDEVSKKYDGYQTIEAKFTFNAVPASGESYQDNGTLYLNKIAGQYKISLNEQELISDGQSVWSVLKEDKEVQVSQADNSSQSIGPNNIFTFYKDGYKYISMDDQKSDNGALKVIELSPENTNSNYFKIKLRINQNNHIHDVTIHDKSGAKYIYKISNLYVNHKISSSTFQFQKSQFPGFEIVDLR